MTPEDNTRLTRVEEGIKHITSLIVKMDLSLGSHIGREDDRARDNNIRFAPKSVEDDISDIETSVKGLDREVSSMPDKLRKQFAGVWVEGYTKAIIFTVGGSIVVGLFFHFLT